MTFTILSFHNAYGPYLDGKSSVNWIILLRIFSFAGVYSNFPLIPSFAEVHLQALSSV